MNLTGGCSPQATCAVVKTENRMVRVRFTYEDQEFVETFIVLDLSSRTSLQSMLVRGEIVGEAVRFVDPAVEGPCTAVLSLSLNGINYTSTQSPLQFTCYVEPILRRINPGWDAMEGANDALALEDGAHPRLRLSIAADGALQCVFPAALPGFYELEGNIIAHDSNAAIQPIWPNPYSLQMVVDNAPFGMSVSYPYRNRFSGSSSGNNGAVKFYAHGQVREFMFSAVEMQQKPNFQVVDWADQGMVYTSMKYSGLTPRLVSSAAISSVNGQPLGGQVRGSKFVIAYNSGQKWVVYALSSDGRMEDCSVGLLHFAMKHQVESIDTSAGARKAFTTPGGSADPVWEIKETQPVPKDFYPVRKIAFAVAQQQRVLDHLREDINAAWSIPLDGSYYFNGKAAQKYVLDRERRGRRKSLLNTCLTKLRGVMTPFVSNSWANKLQYNQIYGGIVSSQGLKTKDLNSDFGNTMYNDHHFHYGYWVHAAAIINRLDPTWSEFGGQPARARRGQLRPGGQVLHALPLFDWFRGHSYSHGVTTFAEGKDQESTSEDVNFAFGMYMFGKATNNAALEAVGKLMTRVNAHAIKAYFLIEDANQIHPTNFRLNKVTGIFFDNKMIPVSAVTEFVRTKQFVKEEWEQVLNKETIVTRKDTWLSLLYASFAMVDKQRALGVLQKAKMDDGLSRSWALYMAASFVE
ncbi:hypothetical protein PHYSODRAFT_252530 [Phytophthora sojae]|uniref:glucan endo-1,3-beta-D-glucosidase n=1 Tax=Phytophthora sojae (strain P6497) TaxID=1094619 RepID=G5ACU3_PHYSP|nr:hypothetical protein PHYSODRAFT_252530 [Phytophthora sojae]EGZ07167.1 hypothetical protein PHYSODRAFT_252530 [Phytophthora sojae]|eukprot:XP_009537931.1 hypothetical protein PHYSODRAFT_252530 [Phytophthora sojae]